MRPLECLLLRAVLDDSIRCDGLCEMRGGAIAIGFLGGSLGFCSGNGFGEAGRLLAASAAGGHKAACLAACYRWLGEFLGLGNRLP